MVQMVFVHGVATRTTDAYDLEAANREKLFREILFEKHPFALLAPRWGDLVPEIDEAVFAGADGVAAFSMFGGQHGSAAGNASGDENGVAELAAQNPAVVLDLVHATLIEEAEKGGLALGDDEVAAFRAAVHAIEDNTETDLLPPSSSDEELAFALGQGAGAYGGGFGGKLLNAVTAVGDRLRNGASSLVFNAVRGDLNPAVSMFLGDVFVYLKAGALRDTIRQRVCEAIAAAHAARAADEPLIVMGHSLGGVILYDMLSSPVLAGLPADLKVDAFLTVGSQPGLFEAMGAFDFKKPGGDRTPGPACVEHWFNVFDPIDPFGFRADPMFEKAQDFFFDSVTGLIAAHSTYFKRPQFYARARTRLREAGLL